MSGRLLASAGVLALVITAPGGHRLEERHVLLAPVALAGQAQAATADTWTPPRTPVG